MITHRRKINMAAGQKPTWISLSREDTNATFVFDLFCREGIFIIEEGTTASLVGTRADGTGVSVSGTLDPIRRTVTVVIPSSLTAVSGDGVYEIVLKKDGRECHSANFVIRIEQGAYPYD